MGKTKLTRKSTKCYQKSKDKCPTDSCVWTRNQYCRKKTNVHHRRKVTGYFYTPKLSHRFPMYHRKLVRKLARKSSCLRKTKDNCPADKCVWSKRGCRTRRNTHRRLKKLNLYGKNVEII